MSVTRLISLLQALYRLTLVAFPSEFRAEFGEEMVEVFGQRLAAPGQGIWAVLVVGGQELGQIPLALLRLRLYLGRKKQQQVRQLLSRISGQAIFGVPPVDNDGRFSRLQLSLEIMPFLLTAGLILLLTYRPPDWLPVRWSHPLDAAVLWAGELPLLGLLLGMVRGMPRWAYPYGGLLIGYSLWVAAENQLLWLWMFLLLAAVSLAVMALIIHRGKRPLPTFFQQIGTSIALDWTRLSFGVFGATPLLILAAFDNAYLNHRTPYLALALLLMVLAALLYIRSRRQDWQLAALLIGTTLLFIPALLDHVYWRGWLVHTVWLALLWAWMVTLLLLPLLSVPTQLLSHILSSWPDGKESDPRDLS